MREQGNFELRIPKFEKKPVTGRGSGASIIAVLLKTIAAASGASIIAF
jgi:hypothetical protein